MNKYNSQKENIFSEEEIKKFVDFYQLLQKIHNRLISEGYIIKDGKLSKPKDTSEKIIVVRDLVF